MIGDKIQPDSRHVGEVAMVSMSYPGRMKIGGRLVELQSIKTYATGQVRFVCRLYNDSSPHGDRYPINPEIPIEYLELCNISDHVPPSGDWHCYNHGAHRDPMGRASWSLPTPPKFASVEEAEEWMAQHEENVRVRGAIADLQDEFGKAAASQQSFGTALHAVTEKYYDQYGIEHCPPIGAFDPDVTPSWTEDGSKGVPIYDEKTGQPIGWSTPTEDLPF